ncbi:MAG: peptidoglycan D,D-transpeptidase FtsI family protein, partial [Rubrobacteraceae bacterium]
ERDGIERDGIERDGIERDGIERDGIERDGSSGEYAAAGSRSSRPSRRRSSGERASSVVSRGSKSPRRRSSGARIVPFPLGRRPKNAAVRQNRRRSTTGESRTVGRRRVAVVLAAFSLVSLFLLVRAVHMTLADEPRFAAFASEIQTLAQPAIERGGIVSADGRELAKSVEAMKIVATPYQIENPDAASANLAEAISPDTGQTAAEINKLLGGNGGEDGEPDGYSVVSTVEPRVAEKVAELDIEGIYLEPSTERIYPDGSLASQTVGYTGEYGEAFGGVEGRYDETLASGEDVNITLDATVQEELESALAEAVEENDAKDAVGIVMRADDGGIVALANHPSYDNNDFNAATAEEQRNRVLTDPYEPGSTFKPFTIAAALEEGAVAEDDLFTVPDHMTVADRVIHDSASHPTEVMTPEGILAESSNVGTVQIAQLVGGAMVDEYISRFGFGEGTGVDLWGEDAGNVPDYEEWSGSSIGNIPIGQGLTTTPLQIAAGYAALANGGHEVEPHISESAESEAEGGGDSDVPAGARVISEETSDIVRGMLQSVVENGTGHLAQIPGYTIAGKTGTSQKVSPETGAYGKEYYASFIGFAPASDPEFVTLIVVDEPQKSIWGEQVAAPAFQKVMSHTLGYFNVAPDDMSKVPGETP